MRTLSLLLTLGLLLAISIRCVGAEISFSGITCTDDVAHMLIGRKMPNDRVKLTEARYKGVRLRYLGGDGLETEGDPWFLASWVICDREYLLLQRRGVVRDVIAAPTTFSGRGYQLLDCVVDGVHLASTVVRFAGNSPVQHSGAIASAWRIDDGLLRFVPLEGADIRCKPTANFRWSGP